MYIRMTFHRRSMCKCDGILCCPPLHHSDILCAEEGEVAFPLRDPYFAERLLSRSTHRGSVTYVRLSPKIAVGQTGVYSIHGIQILSKLRLRWVAIADSGYVTPGTRDSFLSYLHVYVGCPLLTSLRYTRITGLIPFRFGHRVNGRMKGLLPQTDLLSYFCLRYSPTTGCIVSSLFIGLTSFSCAGKTKDA